MIQAPGRNQFRVDFAVPGADFRGPRGAPPTPAMPVRQQISDCISKALSSLFEKDIDADSLLEFAPPQAGDYAFPCFQLAKELRMSPVQIAAKIAAHLEEAGQRQGVGAVSAMGGYVNFHIDISYGLDDLNSSKASGARPAPMNPDSRTVVVEYSQPNTHKPLHVGHARCAVLGDTLSRMLGLKTSRVIPVNYIGDEGTHVATCLWYLRKFPAEFTGQQTTESLGRAYAAAVNMLGNADEETAAAYKKEIQECLLALETGDASINELWKTTRDLCLEEFSEFYSWLDCSFEKYYFESELAEDAKAIVGQYLAEGRLMRSEGTIGMDLGEELGYLILTKSNGAATYASRDVVLALRKLRDYKPDLMVNVVDKAQTLHFKQVFATLDKLDLVPLRQSLHFSYGQVVLPDGKMSSRKGNIVLFRTLKEDLEERFTALIGDKDDRTPAERDNALVLLSRAAIRYGMLRYDTSSDIVFDIKDWTSVEGNTGPYLIYSYARAASIVRKSGVDVQDTAGIDWSQLTEPEEIHLARQLCLWEARLDRFCERLQPHSICELAYSLAKAYNSANAKARVLGVPEPQKRARAALSHLFCRLLKQTLFILGIDTLERV